ncbi:hypothetical protein JCM8547_004394 [Rhodosporidiobolus lusitaniae]
MELLFGATEYSTAVDMWSIGCIFCEFILCEPLLPRLGEVDQVNMVPLFRRPYLNKLLGRPTDDVWPGFRSLPAAKTFDLEAAQPYSTLSRTFKYLTAKGLELRQHLLTYDPEKRIMAEEALRHPYFEESPLPKPSSMFNSFPSVASGEKKASLASPSAPVAGGGGAGGPGDGYDFV